MINLSDKLEGYEEYMTQNLDGSVCKWEYKPCRGLYKWEGWFLEPKKNNYMVSASVIGNKCWEESLIDLATHTPYLIDGILTGVPKLMIPNEECYTESTDVVNKPEHYRQGDIECIDAIKSATTHKLGIAAVCVANVIKYLWRYESKNGLEDVKKAQWYLNRLVKEMEENAY